MAKNSAQQKAANETHPALFDIDRLEYPRPQLTRADYAKLNGEWSFAFDDGKKGVAEKWFEAGKAFDKKITVPFPYQSESSGLNDKDVHEVVWYKRNFTLPKDWDVLRNDQDLMLHFGAVDYKATIYVNGVEAWTNEGGHVPFSLNIAPYLNKDGAENQITVRVEDSQDPDQPRGKQAVNGKSQYIFYYNTTGIWQDVWMEPVPKVRVENIKMTPSAKNKTVDFELPVSLAQLAATVEVEAYDGDTLVVTLETDLGVAGARFQLKFPDNAKLWSPEAPALYDLRIRVKDAAGKTLDEVNSYVGLRDVTIKNGMYYLNGEPVFLIGMLDQGYWPESYIAPPSGEALRKDVEWIKELGCNAARKHQKMEDPRWLYWTDKLGLMVWGEMANAQTSTPEGERKLMDEWRRAVERDYNHPSVITWVPTNESWGNPELKEGNKRQYTFLEKLVELTHQLDQTRPVSPNEGWQLSENTDIVGIHDYSATSTELHGRYKDILTGAPLERFAGTSDQKIMAGEAVYRGQPILLTEVGGFLRNKREESGIGYGTAESQDELLKKFEDLMKGIRGLPFVAGFFYTQFTDVEQEKNGLMTYDRKFVVPAQKIREVIQNVFNPEDMKKDLEKCREITESACKALLAKAMKGKSNG